MAWKRWSTSGAMALLLSFSLMGCAYLDADSCADAANRTPAENKPKGCDNGFLSAAKQRGAIYQGDDSPRLWTGEDARRAPSIDVSTVNRAPGASKGRPIVGYNGTLRVDLAPDDNQLVIDVANLKSAGATRFDPDATTTVRFEKVSIDYFLKQMLTGALGVSYLAPDDLGGPITFRTEQPVPKGQLLQIVRDILGRNGLQMTFTNGVYQIGRPEVIAAMEQTTAAGRESEQVTRVVRVRKGSTGEVAAFVRQLVPADVKLLPTAGGDAIVVRAAPIDIDKVSELITSLSASGVSEDRVAIIPLRHSAPEKVAVQLSDFYRSRIGPGTETVTVIPLENQQAILVGVKDRRVMDGVKTLAAELDQEWKDEVALRIIPLVHLGADEIAQQLQAVFQTGGGGPGPGARAVAAATSRAQRAVPTGQPLLPAVRPSTGADSDEDGSAAASPGFSMSRSAVPGGAGTQSPGQGPSSEVTVVTTGPSGATGFAGAGASPIKIVADGRNNTIMVHSTFSVFQRIREVLKSLDVPQSQVVIEATIAEVNLSDNLEKGVQWFLQTQNLTGRASTQPAAVDPAKTGAFVHGTMMLGNVNVDVVLNALQEITTVKVISSPYLTVVNGKTARLVIGDQIPYSQTNQTSTITGTVTVTQQIQTKDTGIILEVTPHIRSDDSAMLSISQSVSKPQDSVLTGNLTPVISTREVKSDILVQSGRTILLAGLIQDRIDKQENGVPIVRTVPVLGDLFKQTTDKAARIELILMITPRVIRRSSQIENITRLLRGQIKIR
jgi:general secretion pathway protein D